LVVSLFYKTYLFIEAKNFIYINYCPLFFRSETTTQNEVSHHRATRAATDENENNAHEASNLYKNNDEKSDSNNPVKTQQAVKNNSSVKGKKNK
jgi:hypothetical protein